MTDYDFSALNDKEFETFCTRLLSANEGVRYERFKSGRDQGIDGRFFMPDGGQTVLQCKHYKATSYSSLLANLREEAIKVITLSPDRYQLAISMPLNDTQKKEIEAIFTPFLLRDDIFGREDINDLLVLHPDVEKTTYKLWINSTTVLENLLNNAIELRSQENLRAWAGAATRYVRTGNHDKALEALDKRHVVIVTGLPGVGKTTLARQLCVELANDGYHYLEIVEDISEAESAWHQESKQVFYFDDFFGSNYLEAINGHEGSRVVNFIQRVSRHKNKRFVLTSRSTVLNKAKELFEKYTTEGMDKKEFEVRIESLSLLDKGNILYSHLWHSLLDPSLLDVLLTERRYEAVIKHPKFNPRLIDFISSADRIDSMTPDAYWNHIQSSLDNPALIWEKPYQNQADDFGRALVQLVVFNGGSIRESELRNAFFRLSDMPRPQAWKGMAEFPAALRMMTGAFLDRTLMGHESPLVTTFNPSIDDFIIHRYCDNATVVQESITSLQSISAVSAIGQLVANKTIDPILANRAFLGALKVWSEDDFSHLEYAGIIAWLLRYYYFTRPQYESITPLVARALEFVLCKPGHANGASYVVVRTALENDEINVDRALSYGVQSLGYLYNELDIADFAQLLGAIRDRNGALESLEDSFRDSVVQMFGDSLDDHISLADAFDGVTYDDDDGAYRGLVLAIEIKLEELGLQDHEKMASRILQNYDHASALNDFLSDRWEPDNDPVSDPDEVNDMDDVHDLFDQATFGTRV